MSKEKNGGPAFPTEFHPSNDPDGIFRGMTLRDYFAGQVVSAIMRTTEGSRWHQDAIAKHAYEVADAMIVARDRE